MDVLQGNLELEHHRTYCFACFKSHISSFILSSSEFIEFVNNDLQFVEAVSSANGPWWSRILWNETSTAENRKWFEAFEPVGKSNRKREPIWKKLNWVVATAESCSNCSLTVFSNFSKNNWLWMRRRVQHVRHWQNKATNYQRMDATQLHFQSELWKFRLIPLNPHFTKRSPSIPCENVYWS